MVQQIFTFLHLITLTFPRLNHTCDGVSQYKLDMMVMSFFNARLILWSQNGAGLQGQVSNRQETLFQTVNC